jgi:hypothetical protein
MSTLVWDLLTLVLLIAITIACLVYAERGWPRKKPLDKE